MLRLASACLLALPALAQATLIVDATGGPGVFSTLQAAVAAAAPGDTILVRPTAVYDFSTGTSKGLTILAAGPGPTSFRGRFGVVSLPAWERFVMRGFVGQPLGPAASPAGGMDVILCSGEVTLEGLVLHGSVPSSGPATPALYILSSAQVSLQQCTCFGTSTAQHSVLTASACTFNATTGTTGFSAGMGCFGSDRVQLTNCHLAGTVGLQVHSAPVVVTMAGGSASGVAPTGAAVQNFFGGTLRIDSAVVLNGGIQGVVTPYESGRPSLTLAPPGQVSTAGFDGPIGDFGALAIGLPAAPLPSPLGDLWLDPQAYVVIALATVPLQATFVTPLAATSAQSLVAQGVLLHQGSLDLSGAVRALVP